MAASALYIVLVSCVGIYHLRVIYRVIYTVNIPSNIIFPSYLNDSSSKTSSPEPEKTDISENKRKEEAKTKKKEREDGSNKKRESLPAVNGHTNNHPVKVTTGN